ncbi:MAG TPA: GNAT family N-acetyltransferase [Desulfobacteraceae bacterium]|nr:GNAT family N-acetyltransferase [Desulfobacteraceae bacterium]
MEEFNTLQNLIIRNLELRDSDDIFRIHGAITKELNAIDYHKMVKEEVKKENKVSFVAELDGKVVGFIITYILYGAFGLQKSAWIGLFGVEPKYMGSGIGKRMAKVVFDELTKMNIKNIFTSVKWDSVDLLSFFKSLGFDRCEFINLKKVMD